MYVRMVTGIIGTDAGMWTRLSFGLSNKLTSSPLLTISIRPALKITYMHHLATTQIIESVVIAM